MESEKEYKLNILEKEVKSGYNKYTIEFKLKVIELYKGGELSLEFRIGEIVNF